MGAVVPGYAVLAYARDPPRSAADTAACRTALPDTWDLRTVLRPGAPDTESADAPAEKTAAARTAGADAVDFYHYGLVPFPVLERVPTALAGRAA
ncbi:hypothetical protein ACWC09_48325 [Streptomyces sp. NPDC001617]